jgi:hypothetical protein
LILNLAFKEVLTKNDTHDANKDSRNADKACEEEESHIFRIVALYITNEKNDESGEEHYEVVHVFVCLVVLNFTLCEAEVIILQNLIIVKNFFRIF